MKFREQLVEIMDNAKTGEITTIVECGTTDGGVIIDTDHVEGVVINEDYLEIVYSEDRHQYIPYSSICSVRTMTRKFVVEAKTEMHKKVMNRIEKIMEDDLE